MECNNCDSKVPDDSYFCNKCGESLEDERYLLEEDAKKGIDVLGRRLHPTRLVVSVLFGILISLGLGLCLISIGGSEVAIILLIPLVSYLLYNLGDNSKMVLGLSLYAIGGIVPIYPILYYTPIIAASRPDTPAEANLAIGSALGIVVWAFAGFIIGGILITAGYLVRRNK